MKKKNNYYVADFETLVLTKEEIQQGKNTYVWAWAVCDVDNTDHVKYGTDINSFINYISTLKSGSVVYFHNLKYDGQFILSYLLSNGWKQSHNMKLNDHEFNAIVSDIGVFYMIKLKFGKTNISIFDSLKKL